MRELTVNEVEMVDGGILFAAVPAGVAIAVIAAELAIIAAIAAR